MNKTTGLAIWGVLGVGAIILANNLPGRYGPLWQRIAISAGAAAVVAIVLFVVIGLATKKKKG